MPELEPCPVCGHDMTFMFDLDGMPHGIWCRRCHMMVKWSNLDTGKLKTAGEIADAVAARWNRRDVKK